MKLDEASDEISGGMNGIFASVRCHPRPLRVLWVFRPYGVHVTPVHFYEPIPDTQSLPRDLWERDSALLPEREEERRARYPGAGPGGSPTIRSGRG